MLHFIHDGDHSGCNQNLMSRFVMISIKGSCRSSISEDGHLREHEQTLPTKRSG